MKCRMLVLLLAGSALCALGCDGGDGTGVGGLGGAGGGGLGGTGGGVSGGIPTCSGTFTACGGDLTGKWALDGMCLEGDLKTLLAQEEELPPECADAIEDVSIQASGTIEFANGTQTSDLTRVIDMKVKYTSACFSAIAGASVAMDQTICKQLSSSFENPDEEDPEATGSCSFSGGACNCTMHIDDREQSSTGYTVSGNRMTTEDGDSVEFCISGTKLTVREDSGRTMLHRI